MPVPPPVAPIRLFELDVSYVPIPETVTSFGAAPRKLLATIVLCRRTVPPERCTPPPSTNVPGVALLPVTVQLTNVTGPVSANSPAPLPDLVLPEIVQFVRV